MAVAVEMPKLGNTVEECLIAKWLKQEGQTVSAGETVVEIETDKTSFEVTAPVDGTVLATFFEQGALVPVFTTLFVIGNPGESGEAFRPQSKGSTSAANGTGAQTPSAARRQSGRAGPLHAAIGDASLPHSSAPLSPRARRFAEEHNFHPQAVSGSGPGGRVLEADLRALYHTLAKSLGRGSRRVQSGADAPLEGSGIGGMILGADLGPTWSPTGMRQKLESPVFARRSRAACASRSPAPRNTRSILPPTPAVCSCCAPASRLRRRGRTSTSTTW